MSDFERFFDLEWAAAAPTPVLVPEDTGGGTTGGSGTGSGGTGGVATASLRGDPTFSSSKLALPLRDWHQKALTSWVYIPNSQRDNKVADGFKWKPEYANQYVIKAYNGVSYRQYTGPNAGSHYLGRETAYECYSLLGYGLRATGDLTYLDVACADVRHLLDQLDDQGGVGTRNPDGYLSIVFGCDGQGRISFGPGDPRNTAVVRNGKVVYTGQDSGNGTTIADWTGTDRQLEDGLMIAGPMATALAAHVNADLYSPEFEPVGSRPSKPQYYAKVRDDACKFFEDMRAKWLAKGSSGNKKQLPFAIREDLSHSFLNEMVSYVCYAKIKGGANWETHWAYLEAKRAWSMFFGPYEKAGNGVNPNAKCSWYEVDIPGIGRCAVWSHRVNRWNPGSTKDITGEYVSTVTVSATHPNDYMEHDIGAIIFMKMEGCDFIPDDFLPKVANGVNATLNHNAKSNARGYTRNGSGVRMPYLMHGYRDAGLTPPTGWNNPSSNNGSSDKQLTSHSYSGIMAFDQNNELPGYFTARFNELSASAKKQTYGATCAQLFNAAYRAGLI